MTTCVMHPSIATKRVVGFFSAWETNNKSKRMAMASLFLSLIDRHDQQQEQPRSHLRTCWATNCQAIFQKKKTTQTARPGRHVLGWAIFRDDDTMTRMPASTKSPRTENTKQGIYLWQNLLARLDSNRLLASQLATAAAQVKQAKNYCDYCWSQQQPVMRACAPPCHVSLISTTTVATY